MSSPSNRQIITFVVILSFVCAMILSVLASALKEKKEIAIELDRSSQMLIAARILSHNGYFLQDGQPAKLEEGKLVPGTASDRATSQQILQVMKSRFIPYLIDDQGNKKSFEEAGVDFDKYIAQYQRPGYFTAPHKLIYEILPEGEGTPIGYVIPVNGFGLWDVIYGYLAIESDGNTVIGIAWYQQKETPGLGANIADEEWQTLFPGKQVFQPSTGQVDFRTAPIGITVVKGKVAEVLGEVPKALSAVDGMAGATLTGNGVTAAYQDVLEAYRPFLIKLSQGGDGA